MFSGLDSLNFPETTISDPENRNGNSRDVTSSMVQTGKVTTATAKAGVAISLRNPVSSSTAFSLFLLFQN